MSQRIAQLLVLPLAGWLAFVPLAHADDSSFNLDSRFRAKLEKEKVKEAYLERQAQASSNSAGGSAPTCGSQSIGNVNTGGSIGTSPREVFVYAPNATNFVSGPGCH